MRLRSTISTASVSLATATSTPQPECIRKPRAACFMMQSSQQATSFPAMAESFHRNRGRHIRERKRQRDIGILPAVDLDVRIDKVVQRLAVLRRSQTQVPTHTELHAVHIV